MKPFTSQFLLKYLVVCSLSSGLFAWWFGGHKPYPEEELDDLDALVDESLKFSSSNDLLYLKGTIFFAKQLIREQPDKKKRDKDLQARIDKALKDVSKYSNKSKKPLTATLKKIGGAGAVAGGSLALGYGIRKLIERYIIGTSQPEIRKLKPLGGGVIGQASDGRKDKVGPPEVVAKSSIPWTMVIVGLLVVVVIGLALYLFQGNLFAGGDGYEGEDWEYDDETRTKKTKRRKSKKRNAV